MIKSHASIEVTICPVCGHASETGGILLDTERRAMFEMYTRTDWKLCKQHEELHQRGLIAVIECDPDKIQVDKNGIIEDKGTVVRTGKILHISYELANQLFDKDIPRGMPFVFCDIGTSATLHALAEKAGRERLDG